MTTNYSPSIVKNGLVLYWDMTNTRKSFLGKTTTNLMVYPQADWTGTSFNLSSFYDATATHTMTYETGVENPVNSPGVLRYSTGTSGYKFWSIGTSVPSAGNYTFSYYARIVNGPNSTINNQQIWRDAAVQDRAVTGNWNPTFTTEWKRYYSSAYVTTSLEYFPLHSGSLTGGITIEYCGFQLESGTSMSPWVNGTRSNTNNLLDLTGTKAITTNSLTYNSDGSFGMNGTSDYISTTSIPDTIWNNGSWTVNSWVYLNAVNRGIDNSIIGHGSSSTANNFLHLVERGGKAHFGLFGNDLTGNISIPANTWTNICYSFDFSTKVKYIYVNGVLDVSGGTVGYTGTGATTWMGFWAGTRYLFGKIGNIAIWEKRLSTSEIKNNYDALKRRYA